LSTYSNASFSSYASYSSSGTSFFLFVSSYLLSIFPCPPSSPPSNLFSRLCLPPPLSFVPPSHTLNPTLTRTQAPPPPRPSPPTKRSGGPSPASAAGAWAARKDGRRTWGRDAC
jgi:hypothetical protein